MTILANEGWREQRRNIEQHRNRPFGPHFYAEKGRRAVFFYLATSRIEKRSVCVCVCVQSTINLECNPGTGALPIQPPDFLPGTIPLVPRIQETIELRNLVEPQWVGLGVIFIL